MNKTKLIMLIKWIMLNPFEFSEPTNVGITYTVKEVPFLC